MFSQLSHQHAQTLTTIHQHLGETIEHIATALNRQDVIDECNKYSLKQRKGSVGTAVEMLIVGHKVGSASTPDLGDIELKVIQAKQVNGTWVPVENMRLTRVNYNTIQTTPYQDSPLHHKSRMIVVLVEKSNVELKERRIVQVGTVDLTESHAQVETDYNLIALASRNGTAHLLTSKQNQPGMLVKVYSSGVGTNMDRYVDGTGVSREAKGKAFYIFKKQFINLFRPLS